MTGEASNLYHLSKPDKHNRILPSEWTSTAINAARRGQSVFGADQSADGTGGVGRVRRRAKGGWFTNWKAIAPSEAHAVMQFRLPFASSASGEFATDCDEVKRAGGIRRTEWSSDRTTWDVSMTCHRQLAVQPVRVTWRTRTSVVIENAIACSYLNRREKKGRG